MSTTSIRDFSTPIRYVDEEVVVEVRGELDIDTVAVLEETVAQLLDEGTRRLVIDLATTSFVDSTGLRGLLDVTKRCQAADRSLRIVNPRRSTARLIELTGVGGILPVSLPPP